MGYAVSFIVGCLLLAWVNANDKDETTITYYEPPPAKRKEEIEVTYKFRKEETKHGITGESTDFEEVK